MRLIQSIILSISFVSALHAEPLDEHHKLAVELVVLMSTNRPDDTAFQQALTEQIDRVIPQLKLNAKDTELFREAALGAAGAVTADTLIEMTAKAYAKRLSDKELKEIIAFYKTDSGKAWLRESAAIEAEKVVQKKAAIAELLQEILQRFKESKKLNP